MASAAASPLSSVEMHAREGVRVPPVLLIHPSKKVLGKRDEFYSNEYLTPSLGIGMVAASLRQRGVSVSIVDLRLPHRTLDDVFRILKSDGPIMVGISAFTNEITAAGAIAAAIKARHANVFVVCGGPHATALPRETLHEFPALDAVVVGEGETTVGDLAESLAAGRADMSLIQGIAYRDGDRIIETPPRQAIEDIDSLPFPAWELFELGKYRGSLMISASRGCPFPCYFCTPGYLGKVRVRNPVRVVDELERDLAEFGVTRFQFADATLSLLEEQVMVLCDEIIQRNLQRTVTWDCETRADRLDPAMLSRMKEAGCTWIALGVETGNERILREVIRKGETKAQISRAVRMIRDAGIRVKCLFIFGHLHETPASVRETIRFALELDPDQVSFGLMVPNPGSPLRAMAGSGTGGMRILHDRWEDYSQLNYSCFETEALPLAELKRWQSRAYFAFYRRHPMKALALFLDSSGYNYSISALVKIPFLLLRNLIRRAEKR